MMKDENFRDLLDRYLDGTATPEEEAWLESAYINWNRESREELSEAFLQQEVNAVWEKISSQTVSKKSLSLFRRSKFTIFSAAASFVIICTVGFLIIRHRPNSSIDTRAALTKDILPGKNLAYLTLSTGKKIILNDSPAGNLAQEDGVVIIKSSSGDLTYSMSESSKSQDIEYNTLTVPAGGQYHLILQDGSQVWLNASSSLYFPAEFSSERHVKLNGEAYFEISKVIENGKRKPFTVETDQQKIEVLGTHFNVNAYSDEIQTKTSLLEGSVRINGSTVLKPGQQASGFGDSMIVRKSGAEDAIDWKNGDFILQDNDFRTVMRKISRWYNVEVVYDSSAPKKINLGGWISRSKNISSILKIMEQTGKVHFHLDGRRITVSK